MTSPIASQLLDFAARYGNKVLQEQVSLQAPTWKVLKKEKMTGQVGIVNVIDSAQPSVSFLGDGAPRPPGSGRTPIQGQVAPRFLHAALQLNNGALATLNGKADSANYLDGELKSLGGSLAQQIGTSLFAPSGSMGAIVSVSSQFTGSPSTAVIVVDNSAGYKVGMPIVIVRPHGTPASVRAFVVRIAGVQLSGTDQNATLTLVDDVAINGTKNAASGATFAAGDEIFQRGLHTNESIAAQPIAITENRPVSLDDLSGSAAVYGISNPNFVGQRFASIGAPTHEAFIMRMRRMKQQSGIAPNLVIVNDMTAGVLGFGALTQAAAVGAFAPTGGIGHTRKMVDGKLDKYGAQGVSESGVSIGGVRTLSDSNLRESTAFMVNTDHVKVALWQDIEPEKQGGDVALVDQASYGKKVFYSCIYNLYCNQRSTVGRLAGLTEDLL
jgi:hypothetical protein